MTKRRRYADGGGLTELRNLADWWNEFMLPEEVPEATRRALSPERLEEIQRAQQAAREDTKRFIGSAATNVYGVDEEGNTRLPFIHDPKDPEPPLPGIVDQTLALPDWFAQWGGGRGPQWSQDANDRTEKALEEIQSRLGYTPADEPLEYFVEAGGTMALQPPVPGGTFKALKAPFAAAGKYARDVAGPVLGRLRQAASAIPRAGIEFFGPMIEPSAYNYLSGTAFGGALRTLTDQFTDEPTLEDLIRDNGDVQAPDPNLEISDVTPEDIAAAAARNAEFRRKIEELKAGAGMAKGGKVPPKTTLMDLRKLFSGLMSDTPNVEGTGKEMAPVDTSANPIETIEQPPESVRQAEAAGPSIEERLESLMSTPISRRTLLKTAGEQAAASMLPIDLGLELEGLGKAVEAPPIAAAAKRMPIIIPRIQLEELLRESAPDIADTKGHWWADEITNAAEESEGEFEWPHDRGFGSIKPNFEEMMRKHGVFQDPEGNIHYDPEGAKKIGAESNRIGQWLDMSELEKKYRTRHGEVDPWDEYDLGGDDDVDYHGGYVTDMLDALDTFEEYHRTGTWPKLTPEEKAWKEASQKFDDWWSEQHEDFGTGEINRRGEGNIQRKFEELLPDDADEYAGAKALIEDIEGERQDYPVPDDASFDDEAYRADLARQREIWGHEKTMRDLQEKLRIAEIGPNPRKREPYVPPEPTFADQVGEIEKWMGMDDPEAIEAQRKDLERDFGPIPQAVVEAREVANRTQRHASEIRKKGQSEKSMNRSQRWDEARKAAEVYDDLVLDWLDTLGDKLRPVE